MQNLELEPTKTILVTGFRETASFEEFKENSIPKESVAEFYSVPKTYILFIIFYDIREAIKFYNTLNTSTGLVFKYTISKYEIPRKNDECTEKSLQSSINFSFNNLEIGIEDAFVLTLLRNYGEIKELRNSTPTQKTVEFYDTRSAKKAFQAMNNSQFGNGTIQCRWTWDIQASQRAEYLKITDECLRFHGGLNIDKLSNESKRIKLDTSKKSIITEMFDEFIAENIDSIEKLFYV